MKKELIVLTFVVLAILFTGCSSTTSNTIKTTNKGTFEIDGSQITNQVKFFDYEYEGTNIRFFAVKGSDGEVRTAFDACDVCGGSKGYTQRGSDIVCNTCGKSFKIDSLGTENKGYGCWPSYLPHETKGNKIIINTNDLIAQKNKFQ